MLYIKPLAYITHENKIIQEKETLCPFLFLLQHIRIYAHIVLSRFIKKKKNDNLYSKEKKNSKGPFHSCAKTKMSNFSKQIESLAVVSNLQCSLIILKPLIKQHTFMSQFYSIKSIQLSQYLVLHVKWPLSTITNVGTYQNASRRT